MDIQTQSTPELIHIVLTFNTVLLIMALITYELSFANKASGDQKIQRSDYYPFIIVFAIILGLALIRQIGVA
jgi:hypothetical protein